MRPAATYVSSEMIRRYRTLSGVAAICVIAGAALVLASWLAGFQKLTQLLPSLFSMKFNSALCFVLCGFSLYLVRERAEAVRRNRTSDSIATIFSVIALAIPALTLFEYVLGWNPGIDQLFVHDPGDGHSIPGRMAPHTAVALLALACALLLVPRKKARDPRPSQLISLIPCIISFVALTGYLYSVVSLYKISSFTGMALHTAVLLFMMSIGTFFACPGRGLTEIFASTTLGGVVLRRFLPAILTLPATLGWIRMEGQKAGFYGTEFGLAVMVTMSATIFSALVYASSVRIQSMELSRKEAERAVETLDGNLRALRYKLASVLDACPLALATIDLEGYVEVWNPAAEKCFGWSLVQVIGRPLQLISQDRQRQWEGVLHAVRDGHTVSGLDTVCVTREGDHVDVRLWAAPLAIGTNPVSAAVLVFQALPRGGAPGQTEQSTGAESNVLPIPTHSRGRAD